MANINLKYAWTQVYKLGSASDGTHTWNLRLYMAVDMPTSSKGQSRVWWWLGPYVNKTGTGPAVDNVSRRFKVVVDGETIYDKNAKVGSVPDGSWEVISEGTFWVDHDPLTGTWANKTVRVEGYAYSTAVTGTGTTVSIPTIPVPAVLTLNPSSRMYLKSDQPKNTNILTVSASRQQNDYQCNFTIEIGDWRQAQKLEKGGRMKKVDVFTVYWSTQVKAAKFASENFQHQFKFGDISVKTIVEKIQNYRTTDATKKGNLWAKVTLRTWKADDSWIGQKIKWVNVEIIDYAQSFIKKKGGDFTFSINGTKAVFKNQYKGDKIPIIDKVLVQVYGWGTHSMPEFCDINRVAFEKTVDNLFATGDSVRVDTNTATIYKNGAEEPDIGALGNDYETFVLHEGINQVDCLTSSWAFDDPNLTDDEKPSYIMRYREVYK